MKIIHIIFSFISVCTYASQDSYCSGSEEERLYELEQLKQPVIDLLSRSEKPPNFLSQLDLTLLNNAGKSINQDDVIFTGDSNSYRVKNALMHYCIYGRSECGTIGSACYVSLVNSTSACFPTGAICDTDH